MPVWTAQVGGQHAAATTRRLAPLVAGGKVMIGVSGGELGVRGFVAAFDANTGEEAGGPARSRRPGEPGGETWPKGDQ